MLDASDEAEGLAGARPSDDKHGAHRRFDGPKLLGQGSEAHPLSILW